MDTNTIDIMGVRKDGGLDMVWGFNYHASCAQLQDE